MPKLESLDLSNNRVGLRNLHEDTFRGLSKLTSLKLNNSSIARLPDGIFKDLTSLDTLALEGNPGAPFKPVAEAGMGQMAESGETVTFQERQRVPGAARM